MSEPASNSNPTPTRMGMSFGEARAFMARMQAERRQRVLDEVETELENWGIALASSRAEQIKRVAERAYIAGVECQADALQAEWSAMELQLIQAQNLAEHSAKRMLDLAKRCRCLEEKLEELKKPRLWGLLGHHN